MTRPYEPFLFVGLALIFAYTLITAIRTGNIGFFFPVNVKKHPILFVVMFVVLFIWFTAVLILSITCVFIPEPVVTAWLTDTIVIPLVEFAHRTP